MAFGLGDILKAAESIPVVGTGVSMVAAPIQAATGDTKGAIQSALTGIPLYGSLYGGEQIAGDVAGAIKAGSAPPSDYSRAQALEKGLNYGQEEDPNAQLINQLSGLLSGMSPSQAQSILKSLPTGSTLAANLNAALAGEPVSQIVAGNQAAYSPANANPYGFDPLSLGQAWQQVLAPWLSGQQKSSEAGINADTTAMQQALSGVSPQLQGAYAAAIPSQKAAEDTLNQAATQAAVTAPEADNLISGLTNAVNQAKLTQAAASAIPFSTIYSTGNAPSSQAGSPTANAQAAAMKQALGSTI